MTDEFNFPDFGPTRESYRQEFFVSEQMYKKLKNYLEEEKRKKRMTKTSKQLTFVAIVQMLFITLKLLKVIHWSWWWIMAPLWFPTVFGTIVYFILLKYVNKKNAKNNKWKKLFEDVREQSENL